MLGYRIVTKIWSRWLHCLAGVGGRFCPTDWPANITNNCLISCVLIGSFLSSIRVHTDKVLIYASFQVLLLLLFWIKYTYLCLRQVYGFFSPSFIPSIWPFWGLVIVKNKLTSVFYVSVLLLMINFVITLSKFTAEPLWQCYDTIYHQ